MQKLLLIIILNFITTFAVQSQILNDPTLVGYWEFQGNAADASNFMNNGVLQGSPAFVPDELGVANQAIFFNGATDWVNFGDDPSVRFSSQESFTLNVEARPLKHLPGSLNNGYGDLLRYDDFDLADGDEPQSRGVMLFRLRYFDTGFRVELAVGQGPSAYSTLLSNELPYDEWYSFTAVRDVAKDSMYIYVDGCLDTLMEDVGPTWNTTGQYLMCGKYESIFSISYYYGAMQSAHVFKKALNNLEVVELSGDTAVVTDTYATICQGADYLGFDQPGQYYIAYPTPEKCDSIVRLNLNVLPPPITNAQVTICKGEMYNGHFTSGYYTDTLQTAAGCDSIVQLQLNVYMVFITQIQATICEGESYEGYTMPGVYIDTLTSVHGCDSLVVLNLMVIPALQTMESVTICSGESYAGHTTSGVYTDTLLAANGCDSMYVLQLQVLPQFAYDTVLVSDCENALGIPPGIYLDTIDTESCDIIRTTIVKNDNLYIPNVFSPNDDGINDHFEIFPSQTDVEIRRFVVFDRWGEMVFEKNDIDEVRWDGNFRGKRVNPGVYTFMIEFTCGGSLNRRAGTLTLVL